VADGAAMIDAVVRANGGGPPLSAPVRPHLPAALLSDVADALAQVREVATWAARAARRRRPAPATPATTRKPATPPEPADPRWTVPHVITECATTALTEAARRRGGSVNMLFATALARIARTTSAPGADTVGVALPVSGRTEDDPRSNTTRIAAAAFASDALADRDLAAIKQESKRAYRALATRAQPPVALALLQMLPDAVVRKLPQPPAATVLASSLGALPAQFREFDGLTATSVAATAHYPGIGPDEVATIGRGVLGWLSTAGERTTISVCGLDPAGIPDTARLAELVEAELVSWGIETASW